VPFGKKAPNSKIDRSRKGTDSTDDVQRLQSIESYNRITFKIYNGFSFSPNHLQLLDRPLQPQEAYSRKFEDDQEKGDFYLPYDDSRLPGEAPTICVSLTGRPVYSRKLKTIKKIEISIFHTMTRGYLQKPQRFASHLLEDPPEVIGTLGSRKFSPINRDP
jgi:hypothetical protein